MGHYYQDLDRAGGVEYDLCRYAELGDREFRGPPVDLAKPYVAFIGAAQTFGRFVAEPFPTLLQRRLGAPALNLGVGGAGPRLFARPRFLNLLNRAEAVVFQVLSGRSVSCSLFDNSRGGGLTGVTPLAPHPVRAEEFLALAKEKLSRPEFVKIVAEMRADYVAQYLELIGKVTAPRILLWLAKRKPAYRVDYDGPVSDVLGDFPQLVNETMVAEIAAHCDDYVECASSSGIPHRLWRAEQPIEGARLRNGELLNFYYPSPEMHAEAAERLAEPAGRFWAPAEAPRAARFVVIGPERSGTNLLVGMLNQYAGSFCGGELFNNGQIAKGALAWFELPPEERERLIALRPQDPPAFLQALWRAAADAGHTSVGFKLLYNHAQDQPAVADYLAADPEIRVIHVTRRNLLRRLVSHRQAQATNQWAVGRDAEMRERPPVELDLPQALRNFATNEEQQQANMQRFAGNRVLRIVYEDLAARPDIVGARAARFLGLPPRDKPPVVTYQKTGASDLAEAVVGFAELRARARRWAALFDE
jgi:LPS sulfotransferase NodH